MISNQEAYLLSLFSPPFNLCLPKIISNGICSLNPNVDIIDIPETLSKNSTDTNYYGNYYKPSLVLDKSLPVEDAREVIGNTKNSWIKAYESNYQTPYQLDSTQEELQEYFNNNIEYSEQLLYKFLSYIFYKCKLNHIYPTKNEIQKYLKREISFEEIRDRWQEFEESSKSEEDYERIILNSLL